MSDYWISTWGGGSYDTCYSIAADSSDNIYVCGETYSTGAGANDFLIAKYNSSGSIQWQRTLGGGGNEEAYSLATDSSDNVYVCGRTNSTGAGSYDLILAKYNSSGSIQWQRVLGGSSGDGGWSLTTDSNDNIYVCGFTNSITNGGIPVVKYNSSGSIQWQRTLGGSSSDDGYSITTDSSDNIYVCGRTTSTGAGANDFLIAKYNSSGSIQWQRTLGGSSSDLGRSVTVDSNDNIYVCGYTESTGAGISDFLIAKYNSSGSIQWQRTLGGSGQDEGQSITTDSNDNIYVCGYTSSTGAGSFNFLIAKYNSSGSIQWQRVLGGSSGDRGSSITVDSSNNICVGGYTSSTGAGSDDLLIAKLPSDGTLTGTYGPFTYAASSLTDSSSSLTDSSSSLTSSTSSLTSSTSSLTDTGLITYNAVED